MWTTFWRHFRYTLKIVFRTPGLTFWALIFPLIMGTFFKLAFSNIESSAKLKVFDVAIIDDAAYRESPIFPSAFQTLDGDLSKPFTAQYVDETKAQELLNNDEVVGIFQLENQTPKLTFKQNGINQTIFKNVVDEILQTGNVVMEKHTMPNTTANLENLSSANLSYVLIEFYSLVAMTCLYGAFFGLAALKSNLASASPQGRRVSVSPTPKSVVVLSSACAGYVVQLVALVLLFAYTIFVLGVNYGAYFGLVALLSLIGSLAGLALGMFIVALVRKSENFQTGLIIGVTMTGCFLAGMMGVTMKYIVDKNVPILNMINPANLITDGFYALYYYGAGSRFWCDFAGLAIFAGVLLVVAVISLRRQKYEQL